MRSVAVFGSAEGGPGDPLYEEARRVGDRLARAGIRVVTGGYGGVMEGASRGAREANGPALGIVAPAIFPDRDPNPYLSERVEAADLHQRMRWLIERSDGYAVLPGKTGTLAEVALVWALMRAGALSPRPVVMLGASWRRLLEALDSEGVLDALGRRMTQVADGPDSLVGLLNESWR